jgi:inosine-uridine nucleoside N-ribohydrolase
MARPIVIDCDPGTDDAVALLLAAHAPELDLRLVTVAGGNVGLERTLPNARAVIGLAGRPVPIVAGADRPLLGAFEWAESVHGIDGLGGVALPEGPPATPGIAADAIRAALRAAPPGGLTLVGIGPATNLALALATEPALVPHIAEIVLMTGAWGEGNITPVAEFNAASDPEALAILLATGRPTTLVTLDLTAQALVTPERIAALPLGGPCREAVRAILRGSQASRRFAHRGFPLHDPCAIAWLMAPGIFTSRPVSVTVDCSTGPGRGQTVIDRWERTPAAKSITLLESLDADAFFALLAGIP